MPQKAVLVIGSGGKTKLGFIEQLSTLVSQVIIIDGSEHAQLKYPGGTKTVFLQTLDEKSIIDTVQLLKSSYQITAVGTISEPCMEVSAKVRGYLHLPGVPYEKILLTRNKSLMRDFLAKAGVKMPRCETFHRTDSKDAIIATATKFSPPFILKPTTGAANRGLRLVRSYDGFWSAYQKALADVDDYQGKRYEYRNVADEWMICEYIRGKEVETDLYLEEGKIAFNAIREKPLIFEREETIEENSSIIPPLTLTKSELTSLNLAIKSLSGLIYEEIARPSSVKYLTVFAEFRITAGGDVYCLEYTLRPAGALCPLIIQKGTGVDIFEIAARCTIGQRTVIPKKLLNKSVYFQILYSNCTGTYRGISGLKTSDSLAFIPNKNDGDVIKIPQSDYLAFILAEAATQQDLLKEVTSSLENAKILVEAGEGKIKEIGIPLPPK